MATKHNKVKNTGILFEILVRQITSDILSGKQSKALEIMNEFFSSNNELNKELQLYQTLIQEKLSDSNKAEKLIDVVLEQRKKLNNNELRRQKYNLIKAIKENFNAEDFMKTRITDYKIIASVNKLFENAIGNQVTPIDIVNSKFSLIEHITSKPAEINEVRTKIAEEFEQQNKDVRLLAYKLLIERYNEKYADLNTDQKNLLREYINNMSNNDSLKQYVYSEVTKLKKELNKFSPKIEDKVTQIKLNEVTEQIDKYVQGHIITEDHILTLMRYYQLLKELEIIEK